jgi:hypothetical protein
MVHGNKKTRHAIASFSLSTVILLGAGIRTNAVTIPPLTNPCEGVGSFLTALSQLLPFTLFGESSYDCQSNPPRTDSLL